MDSVGGIGENKSSQQVSPYTVSNRNKWSCVRHHQNAKALRDKAEELLEGQSQGGIKQFLPPRQESAKEIAEMRRSLKDEADKELQFLVRKFNEMAPQIQKDTKHGQCPHTAETTYQEMKRVMKETKNPNPIKYWELARINDKGAHYAVMFLPKKDAIKEGAVSEWNTLPLGDANSKITKKFPYGVVLESSMLEGASLGTGKPPILLPTTEAGPSGDMEIGTSTGLARQVRYGRSTLSSTARATGPKDPRI